MTKVLQFEQFSNPARLVLAMREWKVPKEDIQAIIGDDWGYTVFYWYESEEGR